MVRTVSLFLALVTPATLAGQAPEVEFSGRTWRVVGEGVKVERYLGREAVRFRSGAIVLPDVQFENGTVEFDMATSGHRSFSGLAFRIGDGGFYEDFYLRPHNSGRFDAMQYTPVFNGISAWQLYPEYNASIEIPTDRWLHVKLVISGSRLEVYFDGAGEPTLVVDDLKGDRRSGRLALKSNFPAAGELPELYPVAFANFVMRPDDEAGTYNEPREPTAELVRRWALSPAVPAPEGVPAELPAELMATDGWTVVEAESSGLVNLARYRGTPPGSSQAMLLARTVVESDRDRVKKLNFGFSDRGSIFLNGQILFSANNTYRSRSQRYLGVVTVENDAVYLPLRRGENELLFAVSEAFGGWGLIARFENLDGISLDARAP